MNKRNSDVLVIGAGMSGLVAALAAARRGRKVTVLSRGVGALAIGSGCVDVLGYVNGLFPAIRWMPSNPCPRPIPIACWDVIVWPKPALSWKKSVPLRACPCCP